MRLLLSIVAVLLAAGQAPAIAREMSAPDYPDTRQSDTSEFLFGERIADPYRWLENDVRNDAEVADWVERQNAVTDAYLDTLPARDWFTSRITELFDFERFSTPAERGGRYFYTRNTGLQNQSPLYVREGIEGEPRLQIGRAHV